MEECHHVQLKLNASLYYQRVYRNFDFVYKYIQCYKVLKTTF